jgi:CRISPR-associated protein Csx10
MSDRYYYIAELKDSISISSNHSSEYSQICLDYIPGSAVSGALACRLYSEGSGNEKILDRVFQNNEAVFSNCLPLEENDGLHAVFPAPSCLHYEKGADEDDTDYINLVKSVPGKVQLKQVRSGYLNSSGGRFSVVRHSATKTAIDPDSQTAAESKLFTLNFIDSGTRFWGYVDIPDGTIPKDDMEKFLNSTVRIGKCRSSEFGRVKLSLIPADRIPAIEKILLKPSPAEGNDRRLYLWCLSDVEFVDLETAAGTFVPQGSNLWLDCTCDIKYNPEKSFIRTGRIRYFNRKRNGYDSEKCLIKRGSVICFDLGSPLDAAQLEKIARDGVGLSRHQGLGRVMVNPSWINSEMISDSLYTDLKIADAGALDCYDKTVCCRFDKEYGYLTGYIDRKSKDMEAWQVADRSAGSLLLKILDLYTFARNSNSLLDTDQYGRPVSGVELGPTNSQWGILLDIVSAGTDVYKKIEEKLADERQRDSSSNTWDIHFSYKNKTNTSFAKEFLELIKGCSDRTLESMFDVLRRYDLSKLDTIKKRATEMEDSYGK